MCFITNPLAWYYFAFQDNILWTAKGKNGTNKSGSKIGVSLAYFVLSNIVTIKLFFRENESKYFTKIKCWPGCISSIHISEDNDIGSRSRIKTLFLYSTLSFFSSSVSEMAIGTPCSHATKARRLTLSFSLIY